MKDYYRKTRRKHQKDANRVIDQVIKYHISDNNYKGKVILPTGTGKTLIEADTICSAIRNNIKNGIFAGIHVISFPRIILTFQQLQEISIFIALEKDIPCCNFINVNSGYFDSCSQEKQLFKLGYENPSNILSTTNSDSIAMEIIKSKNDNSPLIIFCTYHSADKVNLASKKTKIKITTWINDECQYLVTNGKHNQITNYSCQYMFNFTAIEKFTDSFSGLGMNNIDRFGKLLFTEKPKTLIDRGEMASVAIHFVGTTQNIDENDYESTAKIVISSFEEHKKVIKKNSKGMLGGKILVVCLKQDSLKGILNSKFLKFYKANNQNVKIYALSSDFGIYLDGRMQPRVNNKEKSILLKELRSLKDSDDSIIFHVDMLSEGIDVPGLTGVLPFRNLGKSKFLQNIGRGTRLASYDRSRLYNKEIDPKDFKNYIKPFCYVVLPYYSNNSKDAVKRYFDYISGLRSEYEFDLNEIVIIDNIIAPNKQHVMEDLVGVISRKQNLGKGIIEEIFHIIEKDENDLQVKSLISKFEEMSIEEKINFITTQ